jgi:hypothetical protein
MPGCVPNIGPGQPTRGPLIAAGAFLLAAVALGVLFLLDLPRWWRLALVAPLWLGALCIFQVRMQTCVYLADRGVRNMDDGDVSIHDAIELKSVKAQARAIRVRATALAILLTLLTLLI